MVVLGGGDLYRVCFRLARAGDYGVDMKRKPIDHYSLISEKAFTAQVIELARRLGWKAAHFRPGIQGRRYVTAMQGDVGFPDLVLARNGKVLFAELKSESGRLSEAQLDWANTLRTLRIWRPRDIDLIEAELR